LDMSGVPFIDSTCLGVLLGAMRHANGGRGGMRVASARPRVRRAIEIAALDEQLPLYATVEAAVADRPAPGPSVHEGE
ncbi:MAG: STAS domain-containing protein, partial [Acidimicrobiales bacterium]